MLKVELLTTVSLGGTVFRPSETVLLQENIAKDLIYRNRAKIIPIKNEEFEIDISENKKRIAIVGTSGTRILTPYDDQSWQIWTLNHRFDLYKRTDRHFDLHNLKRPLDKKYVDFLKNNRVILAEADKNYPNAELYPKKAIMEEFGDYFTNSISWMIALAIKEGADEIGLFGVDMALKSEYEFERPSVLYYMGFGVGRGVKFNIPQYSKIFDFNEKKGFCYNETDLMFNLGIAAGKGFKFNLPEKCEYFKKDYLYWLL